MRPHILRVILFAVVAIIAFYTTAVSAEPVPGNSCSGYPAGAVMRSSGTNSDGVQHVLSCMSGSWVATVINPVPQDLTPNAFSFTNLLAENTNTLTQSNTVTISGITGSVPVSITGTGSPQFSIAGGSWVTSGTITNGQTLRIRLTSSTSEATAHTATVTVGTVSQPWSVTTQDLTPNNFAFTTLTNQATSTLLTSNTVTINGITGSVPVSFSLGGGYTQLSINGGAWTTSGTITNGQTLQLRMTSSPAFSTTQNATVTVGSVTQFWGVTTAAQDTTPNAFSFTNITGHGLNTLATSAAVTISGITGSVPVSITGTGTPQFRIAGGSWVTSGNITNGQTLELRLTSANAESTARSATITIGTESVAWSVTTNDNTPNAFSFTNQTGVTEDTQISSNTITLSGFGPAAIPVSVISFVGDAQISINGGAWTTSGTISSGQTLRVRMTSASAPNSQWGADIIAGTVSTSWAITTAVAQDTTPNAFSFTNLTGQAWSTSIQSNTVTISGITGSVPVSITGTGSPQFRIAGGSWVTSGNITNGQTLQLRQTTPTSFHGATTATVTATVNVGTVSETWSVTTNDDQPNSFAFGSQSGVALNTQIVSNLVTIQGIGPAPVNVSISGADGSPQISINGGAWTTSGTITNGQTISARLTSANTMGTTRSATISIGSIGQLWQVTTVAIDTTPNAFSFTSLTGQSVSTQVMSNSITISGINAAAPVTISGPGSPQFRIAGGSWVTSGNITNGQSLQLRMTTPTAANNTSTVTATVGGVAGTWQVTTQDPTPDNFSFTTLSNQNLNTVVTSNIVTITGITGTVPVSVSGPGSPQISINGGGWTTSGTIINNQTIQLRQTTSPSYSVAFVTAATVGTLSRNWTVTTVSQDITPNAFSFTNQTNQEWNAWIESNTVTISGITGNVDVTLSGANTQFRIAGGAWRTAATTITDGQSLQLRTQTANAASTVRSATITVGVSSQPWSVTTHNGSCSSNGQSVDGGFCLSHAGAWRIVRMGDSSTGSTKTNASTHCSNLGSGWRLPNMAELGAMYNSRSILGNNFSSTIYWSSEIVAMGPQSGCLAYNFGTGTGVSPTGGNCSSGSYNYRVRCIKNE